MFSQASVSHSVHRGGGGYPWSQVPSGGGSGYAWSQVTSGGVGMSRGPYTGVMGIPGAWVYQRGRYTREGGSRYTREGEGRYTRR